MTGQKVEFKCDSGAQVNVLNLKQCLKLGIHPRDLVKTKSVITSFTKDRLPVVGKCKLPCRYKSFDYLIDFYVVDSDCFNIIGLKTSEQLGFIVRVETIFKDIKYWVPSDYKLFDGQVGYIPQEVTITIDPRAKSVVLPARRIPYALLLRVKSELDRMQKMGIIEPVTEPTDWVSQMVMVGKKDGSLRICLNPQPLNRAIKREHFQFPTIDEISAKLSGAKYFCKLDAQSGFWILQLDRASSRLCTFQTAWGDMLLRDWLSG